MYKRLIWAYLIRWLKFFVVWLSQKPKPTRRRQYTATQILIILVRLYFKLIWKVFSIFIGFIWKRVSFLNFLEEAKTVSESLVTAVEIPTILEQILKNLPVEDLKECSVVNRFWKDNSRHVLRTHKRCEINLGTHDCSCTQLQTLNNMLANSKSLELPFIGSRIILKPCKSIFNKILDNDLPFIGLLRTWMPSNGECEQCYETRHWESKDVVSLYPFLFKKLPVKNLVICYLSKHECVGEIFLRKLLTTVVPYKTENLNFMKWPESDPSLWDYLDIPKNGTLFFQPFFKSVTTCKIGITAPNRAIFIGEVIRSAPKLRHFYCVTQPGMLLESRSEYFIGPMLPQIPKSRWHLLRSVNIAYAHQLHWIVETQPTYAMEGFGFWPTVMQPTNNTEESRIKDNLSTIAQRIRGTLKNLRSNESTHLLHLIINQGPFLNLHVLLLDFNPKYRSFEDNILLLQTIDYANFLPSLTKVDVSVIERDLFREEIIPKHVITDYALVQQSAQHRCLTVTKLKLDWYGIYWGINLDEQVDLWLQLAEVFPNVKSFTMSNNMQNKDIWTVLHEPWKDLEHVACYFDDGYRPFLPFVCRLLVELTCNIEWDELEIIDCNQLKNWSYTPSRVTFCEKTRVSSISIRLNHRQLCIPPIQPLPPILWTRFLAWIRRENRIDSWIRTKFPEFTLRISFDNCGPFCNPVSWHSGEIHKRGPDISDFMCHQNNWVLIFKN